MKGELHELIISIT